MNQTFGAFGGGEIGLDLNAGDVVRLRAQRTLGGAPALCMANGSRLKVRRL